MRAFVAVVVGFVVWTVLWLGSGAAVRAAMPDALPTEGAITDTTALLVVLALSVVCSLVAGFVTVRIQAAGPAVIVLAILLLVVGIGVQASGWDRMPVWYHLVFLALLVPMTLLGGRLGRGGKSPSNATSPGIA